jgi:sterol desaturase/sphingolipid hydroxylase (fatty acid hydroxylase superfamily)
MTEAILNNEATIRLSFFLGIFALMAIWETIAPRRARTFSRLMRWPSNLGIVALNTLLIRVLFPVAAVGLAGVGQQKSWGLLNNFELPNWLAVLLAVALLDLIIYLQHVI